MVLVQATKGMEVEVILGWSLGSKAKILSYRLYPLIWGEKKKKQDGDMALGKQEDNQIA